MPELQYSIPRLDYIYDKVIADSRFSLHYLRTLRMVDFFIDVSTNMRYSAETAELTIRQILALFAEDRISDDPIDPTGDYGLRASSAEAVVKHSISTLQEIGETLGASDISDEHMEAMANSKESVILAFQKLHDAIVDLRWAVMEHDADLEEPEPEVFENVDDFIADLKSG